MTKKITVISHIFNEEYLLPFWLEHHSQIFDHGIIIDYCSTDRSIEIINKMCPGWQVVTTKNLNENGTPNFEAKLVDMEVKEIESTIDGYKMCLNTTEFLIITKDKNDFINSLQKNKYYCTSIHSIMSTKQNSYPKNTTEFFNNINFMRKVDSERGHRILHSSHSCNYSLGRHYHDGGTCETDIYPDDFFILWCQLYPCNHKMMERKLQIQNNIPQSDKDSRLGYQHIIDFNELKKMYNNTMIHHIDSNEYNSDKMNAISFTCESLKKNNIYYTELLVDYNWGEDNILLENDINLLKKTDFDEYGYKILNIENFNDFLQEFIKEEIKKITQKEVNLLNYHNEIANEEHTAVLNAMPYKKNSSPELTNFSKYLEDYISKILGEPIKIFNDDLWFRICRPNNVCSDDFNPCHRDVYLDFYRNIVNIYLPVVGSNENSSLKIQPGSHKWNENETIVTKGGAFFRHTNKKYSVDAIVASKKSLEMIRPDPQIDQMMLFSPYLIHGCSDNSNENETRISLEVRFIRNDENGQKQEADFNEFLKVRNWR
jgi:ectoine hydroxylase-related dioxygenase (phytanoyl-CoA dioxygenase family)